MRAALLMVAACGTDWDGTFRDGLQLPVIIHACADDHLVIAFDDDTFAATTNGDIATPYVNETFMREWTGSLFLQGDRLETQIDGSVFSADRVDSLGVTTDDCSVLVFQP